jgi:DNA-binding LytR/AlgR family response regulator
MLTALIVDDEPLAREELRLLLEQAGNIRLLGECAHAMEALPAIHRLKPDLLFLDIQMPRISGLELVSMLDPDLRPHIVFITAYDHYALQAFEHGVFDYLVKPVQLERLTQTLARLQQRLRLEQPTVTTEALLQQLAQQLQPAASAPATQPLRWIRAAVGGSVRLIPVDDIDYLKSDEKYTLVAWRGDGGRMAEALIRTSLKALLEQLDPAQFLQVHRAVVVNLNAVSHVTPDVNEKANLHFKHRPEVLPVSRTYLHHFKAE